MTRSAARGIAGSALLLMTLSRPARAQEAGRFELSLFGGASIGSRLSLTSSADVRLGDGAVFGLRGAYRVSPRFTLEGTWSHTDVQARTTVPMTDAGTGALLATNPVKIEAFDFNGLTEWGHGPVRGNFGLGAGVMSLSDSGAGLPNMGTRLSFNAGFGMKVRIADGLDARLDARYRVRTTPNRVSVVHCREDGCKPYTTTLYSSADITAGLAYRFGASPFRDVLEPAGAGGRAPGESDERFWAAAGGVVLMELVPWGFVRYVTDQEYVRISMETLKSNFRAGFGYDRDNFKTDQSAHSFHGNLFYNAARSNGYGFWESGLFTLAGGWAWECCLEREPPSINDLINTTLGGMSRGEVLHRLATMVRNNQSSGWRRFWRELGGAALDTSGAVTRLTRGELSATFENPPDRNPKAFFLSADGGYRHLGGDVTNENQGLISLNVAYGDPFLGELKKPYDSFTVTLDIAAPGGVLIPRLQQRGLLRGWELTDSGARSRHVFGFVMDYEYIDNASQVFGAQILGAALLSRYTLSPALTLRSDFTAGVVPLAGIGTTDILNPVSGRTFDFAPGGGLHAGVRLESKGRELLSLVYSILWATTVDGSTSSNRLQNLLATGRLYFGKKLGVGGGLSWYQRDSFYGSRFEEIRTQTEWRAFLSWRLL